MKVCAAKFAVNTNKNVFFRGRDEELNAENIDKFLKNSRISKKSSFVDLKNINQKGYSEKIKQLHLKRNINEISEASDKIFDNPLDIFKRYDDSDFYKRIFKTQSNESAGLFKILSFDKNILRSIFKKGAPYFSEGAANSSLINNITIPEITSEIVYNKSIKPSDVISNIFLDFKNNDMAIFNNSISSFSQISNSFFQHTSQKLIEVKGMKHTFQKWIERVPVLGLKHVANRVAMQQQAVKYIYQDYNDYCNKYIHKGIRPIAQSYLEKIRQTQNCIDILSPFASNQDLQFFEEVTRNMKAMAEPLLEKYTKMITSVTSNGEALSNFYKAINSNGNIRFIIKSASTVFIAI